MTKRYANEPFWPFSSSNLAVGTRQLKFSRNQPQRDAPLSAPESRSRVLRRCRRSAEWSIRLAHQDASVDRLGRVRRPAKEPLIKG